MLLTDDGSGKWPYAGSLEAAKALGANVVEKVKLPRLVHKLAVIMDVSSHSVMILVEV